MQAPPPHLVPLKVCAMLALANILSKSFLAFVYIGEPCSRVADDQQDTSLTRSQSDLGLSLARNLDDPTSTNPQTMQRPEYLEAKRVQVTLLSLRGYAHEYGGLGVGAERS
jgi:hypothetical protein